jgi:dTDP-3-amino-3,4,6-trideoxy-alpha-D-glucose transaminase
MSTPTLSLSAIPANDFQSLWREIEEPAMAALRRVGQSGWFILGREVQAFESALAAFWGLDHAIGCGNGMDAIEIALRAGGLQPGERVLTTPLSAFATTLAIQRAGGIPVFIDVDANGLLDLHQARRVLAADLQLRWMVPVHLFGQCMDLEMLKELRDEFSLKIVEDCAQSIGATWHAQPCGSVGFAATTSFYPTKNLGALGDGGALLTNNPTIAAAARHWRDYGQSEKYVHTLPGLNSRLDEVHAAILHDAMLPRLRKFTQARAAAADAYRNGISHADIQLLDVPPACGSVHHLFPVMVTQNRESFMLHVKQHGIGVGIHYPSLIPDQPAMLATAAESIGTLTTARRLAAQEVSLPIHPHLTSDQIDRVIEACNSWRH